MAPLEFTQSESASSAVLPHVPESEASVIQTKTLWVQLNNQTYQGLTPEQTGERLLPFIVEDWFMIRDLKIASKHLKAVLRVLQQENDVLNQQRIKAALKAVQTVSNEQRRKWIKRSVDL